MFRKIIFFTAVLVIPLLVISQDCYKVPLFIPKNSSKKYDSPLDSIKHKKKKKNNGLYFGLNLGAYKANSYTAQYYNGSGINRLNDSLLKSIYNYQSIESAIGAADTSDYHLGSLPSKMKYNVAFLVGLCFDYNINNSGIILKFNFSQLKASDVFTIDVYDPNNPSTPIYKQESITGSEQRFNLDLGYSYTFNPKKKDRPYVELGFNMNNTKFMNNQIKIESMSPISIANPYYAYYSINVGGIGYGAFLGGGIDLNFNESISVNPGFDLYYIKTKLGNYDSFKFNYSFFVTFILNGLL